MFLSWNNAFSALCIHPTLYLSFILFSFTYISFILQLSKMNDQNTTPWLLYNRKPFFSIYWGRIRTLKRHLMIFSLYTAGLKREGTKLPALLIVLGRCMFSFFSSPLFSHLENVPKTLLLLCVCVCWSMCKRLLLHKQAIKSGCK